MTVARGYQAPRSVISPPQLPWAQTFLPVKRTAEARVATPAAGRAGAHILLAGDIAAVDKIRDEGTVDDGYPTIVCKRKNALDRLTGKEDFIQNYCNRREKETIKAGTGDWTHLLIQKVDGFLQTGVSS